MKVGALALALAGGAAAACPLTPDDGRLIEGDALQVAWTVAGGGAIEVGQPFELEVRACPDTAELRAVDATMPAHRHGMNYRPSIVALAPGRWRVQGLIWHMRGGWELALDLHRAGRTQTLRQAVDLQ
ncbi:MAG: hypothetical protein OEW22_00920 [Rubrivivax sp.]|nr:hypothetical protein [Rubrivivax sp.]